MGDAPLGLYFVTFFVFTFSVAFLGGVSRGGSLGKEPGEGVNVLYGGRLLIQRVRFERGRCGCGVRGWFCEVVAAGDGFPVQGYEKKPRTGNRAFFVYRLLW